MKLKIIKTSLLELVLFSKVLEMELILKGRERDKRFFFDERVEGFRSRESSLECHTCS